MLSELADTGKKEGMSPFELSVENIFCEIVEDIILDICYKVHRALKLEYFAIDEYLVQDGKFILYNAPATNDHKTHDLLALTASSKKPSHINCPHCKRKLGTNRFAPHLNSCMGEGRTNKDRNAKRNFQTYESDDDDDDEDYTESGKKKKKKAKNPRKTNKPKGKRFFEPKMKVPFHSWVYRRLRGYKYIYKFKKSANSRFKSLEGEVQIDEFLSQKCGVVSRKSKSMCNNTLKCSIHTEEQRKEIRRTLLNTEPVPEVVTDPSTPVDPNVNVDSSAQVEPNVHIDVDTVDVISRSPSPDTISVCSNNSVPSLKLDEVYQETDNPDGYPTFPKSL